MINEERVRQLYKVAMYEQREEKLHRQIGKYYRSDYIGKEILKSIFTGSVAYIFLLVLVAVSQWEKYMSMVNQMDISSMLMPLLVVYVAYMAVYLIVTYMFFKVRYEDNRKRLDEYEEELRVLNQMYEREEKLKQ